MDLLANKKCAQVAWTYRITIFCSGHMAYMIAILCSDCMDLYNCHYFVLRSHGLIQLVLSSAFCTQVTYDLFCMCELTAQRDFGFAILCSGHMDLYNCHFVLRSHRPIQLTFCTQVTQTYYIYSTLKYYNAALCHPQLPFIPIMYTFTIL